MPWWAWILVGVAGWFLAALALGILVGAIFHAVSDSERRDD